MLNVYQDLLVWGSVFRHISPYCDCFHQPSRHEGCRLCYIPCHMTVFKLWTVARIEAYAWSQDCNASCGQQRLLEHKGKLLARSHLCWTADTSPTQLEHRMTKAKRAIEHLKLESGMVVSGHMGAGNQALILWKSSLLIFITRHFFL